MPGDVRARFSKERRGESNPNYRNGEGVRPIRFQVFVRDWALENLGGDCEKCGDPDPELHHIVSRDMFPEVEMSHFRQNLALLCVDCHRPEDGRKRKLLGEGRARDLLFADRLPEPILDQLERDGSVSELPSSVDFSPLGNAAEEVVQEGWFADS